MAEDLLIIASNSKKEKYEYLFPQIKALVEAETNTIANMANIVAAIKETFQFLWVGFYQVIEDELVLAPFQGPIACTRIKYGKGVCGTAWKNKETLLVPDVELFPGHIACSSLSRSEIVVPVIKDSIVIAILDIDSENLNEFDETDKYYLGKIVKLLVI